MKIAKTAPEALKILWEDKLFFKKQELGTVKSELEKKGYNFTDYNLSMALKNAKFLTRNGPKGNYTYVQKHPYIGEEENAKRNKKN